jgi:hypothetical protein
VKIYHLSLPIAAIMDSIEEQKRREAKTQIDLIQQLKEILAV